MVRQKSSESLRTLLCAVEEIGTRIGEKLVSHHLRRKVQAAIASSRQQIVNELRSVFLGGTSLYDKCRKWAHCMEAIVLVLLALMHHSSLGLILYLLLAILLLVGSSKREG